MSVQSLFDFHKVVRSDRFRGKESDVVLTLRCRIAYQECDFGSFFLGLRLILNKNEITSGVFSGAV